MEDRKRHMGDDAGPPTKRQQTNGTSKSRDEDRGEESWIESYTKDAIYRQMLEYKREKTRLESRLEDLSKKYDHYDDHLRVVDGWWLQEIQLVAEGVVTDDGPGDIKPISGLDFSEGKTFEAHLADKANTIKPIVESLLRRIVSSRGDVKPEVDELETRVKTLLATHKEDMVRLEGLIQKKDELSASLDTAMLRAVKAEKKLDRAKSAQVQKMEAQAMGQATTQQTPVPDSNKNGNDASHSNGHDPELQLKFEEATAAEAKLKEQLTAATAELKALKEENTHLKMRRESVTDDDYVRTDVFKAFKGQNEDLLRRVNDLEVLNKQLRLEAEKLQLERTTFRAHLEREAQAVTEDLEAQIQAREADLNRIRTQRDEFLADLTVLKKTMETRKESTAHMQGLVAAKDDRIASLDMELERLKPQADAVAADDDPDLMSITIEDLRDRFVKCRKDLVSIKQELPAIEGAYKQAMTLAQKKAMDLSAHEDQRQQLVQEKHKADQKYFAARKDADIRNNEVKALRQQNGKSSEIITVLKDHEKEARTLNSNLEKQLADLKQSNIAVVEENRQLKSTAADAARRTDHVKSQIGELQTFVKTKDSVAFAAKEQASSLQVELEKLKRRIESVTKERDNWKKKGLENVSPDEELLNDMIWCKVCTHNPNNVVIATCGHIMCRPCAEDRISNRLRGCPTCNTRYDKSNIVTVFLAKDRELV